MALEHLLDMNALTFAKNVCFNRLFYFIDGKIFDVHNNVVSEVPNYALVVVSATEYLVDEKIFPTKGRELKKLTSLYAAHNAPFASQKIVKQLIHQSDNKSKYAFCYFKENVIEVIKQQAKEKVFLLPEELVIAHLDSKYELGFAGYKLTPQVFGVQKSASIQTNLLAKLQPDVDERTFENAAQWLSFLFSSVQYKNIELLSQSLFNVSSENKLKQIEPYINVSVLSVLLYVTSTTGYLAYKKEQIESHLSEQREAQKELRQAEQNYNEKLETVNVLKEPFNSPEYAAKTLAALGQVHAMSPFRIERLNFSQKTFRITGKAEDDVAVFKALNDHPDIYNVAYTTPTIKRGKFATFNISFTVEDKVL